MEKRIAALEKRVAALENKHNHIEKGHRPNKKERKTKRKVNDFVKMSTDARKKNKKEFVYNGTTYYAHPHPIFKTVYKKDKP